MISFKKQYGFIHIKKTAGSSIKVSLKKNDQSVIKSHNREHSALTPTCKFIQQIYKKETRRKIDSINSKIISLNRFMYNDIPLMKYKIFNIDDFFMVLSFLKPLNYL